MRCDECKFYVPFIGKAPFGDCHLNPPTPTSRGTIHPEVRNDNWCGQWRKKTIPFLANAEPQDDH